MTEDEWLCSKSVDRLMFDELLEQKQVHQTKSGKRKLRLFACSCSSRIVHLIDGPEAKALISVVERYADGKALLRNLRAAQEKFPFKALTIVTEREDPAYSRSLNTIEGKKEFARQALSLVGDNDVRTSILCAEAAAIAMDGEHSGQEVAWQANLLRDIFGNPFRPITLDPRWLTSSVVDLSQAIYQERAFDRMPILADALMDAGCDSEEMIAHCRGPGPYVRGCWVVDLLLGKE